MSTAALQQVVLPGGACVDVRITGNGPVPVVALAGGAAASIDFFPGIRRLERATVVEHDRVGTGRTSERTTPATLASAATDLHALRLALDLPPVVVLAQSFGGAVLAQWLVDHPDDIAGAIIIDPTPVNDGKTAKILPALTRTFSFLLTTPLLRSVFGGWMARVVEKTVDPDQRNHPDMPAALDAILDASQWGRMAKQFATIPTQFADLTRRLTPHPGHILVLGAERKQSHRVRLAHEEMCRRIGASYQVTPGAVHTEHLRQPRQVMNLVQSVVDEVGARETMLGPEAQPRQQEWLGPTRPAAD